MMMKRSLFGKGNPGSEQLRILPRTHSLCMQVVELASAPHLHPQHQFAPSPSALLLSILNTGLCSLCL